MNIPPRHAGCDARDINKSGGTSAHGMAAKTRVTMVTVESLLAGRGGVSGYIFIRIQASRRVSRVRVTRACSPLHTKSSAHQSGGVHACVC